MYDIFLSYSTQDRERLIPLVRALEQQGWSVFWDHRSVPPGKNWHDVIGDAIRVCRTVVVVWSKHSVNSNWVKEEALEGRERNVLFPVLWDGTPQPFGFKLIQSVDFSRWNEKSDHSEFVRLSNQISALVGGETIKPVWASMAGDDQYGRYADLVVKGITQKFRWIEPGTFWMGSPESEPDRFGDETRHQVTLTKGFWLADTACTQFLWTVVLDNNPAHFTDDANNPVEEVSWEDTQTFLQKLNTRVAGLNARLPTEAEWEYACRAGTKTPFSFGDNITPLQVNYNGKYPCTNGEIGLSRQRTVSVKSFPANVWGLYEIHGNVWEWCQDWYGDYPAEPVTNPEGSQAGIKRVVRGGSWLHRCGRVRSAYRDRHYPVSSAYHRGFRLALGL